MDLGQIGTVPLTLGAVVTGGALVVGIVKGTVKVYDWFMAQVVARVAAVVSDALKGHEEKEEKWQQEITGQLGDIRERLARIEGRMEVEPSKETKP